MIEGKQSAEAREEHLDGAEPPAGRRGAPSRTTLPGSQQMVPVALTREDVDVAVLEEEVEPVGSGAEAVATSMLRAFQEGTIRVPLRGEEAIATKKALVAGEIVISKENVLERQQVTHTLRKEYAEVDERYQQVRPAFEQHFAKDARIKASSFAAAEPSYRTGFAAAHDERYANKVFEDVEPELRREHEQAVGAGGAGRGADDWEALREAVREGFARGRDRSTGNTP